MALFDTIVAPITGTQAAAVAVIRVSGNNALEVAAKVFPSLPPAPEYRHAFYGTFTNGDDGILLLFESGHSYTGEATAEMSIHGSRASVASLLAECRKAGARDAEPGEFTQRAFLNGRLDLTQAEAVRDTIEAETQAQLRMASLLREGALRNELSELRDRLVGQIAAIEASVDFSEEVGDLDKPRAIEALSQVQGKLERLLATANAGRLLRSGLRIAIVGPPNAGKSSLLNRLLGSDRAIVSEIPGTTRDFVEEALDLAGLPVVLTDTAGLRKTSDPVERTGVERALKIAAAADEVWYVYDLAAGWTAEDEALRSRLARPTVTLANKSDLPTTNKAQGLRVSAQTGEGLDELIETFARRVQDMPAVAIDMRHEEPLKATIEAVKESVQTLGSERPVDLASISLREAVHELGTITGETATPDMIERIFRDFCIGK